MEAKAYMRYVRISPRKVGIVCDLIRGKDVKTAAAYLMQTPKAASEPMLKLLKSAIANAENNHNMQIPNLSKIIVNVGCGESKGNSKEIEAICKDIATITGQKPITTKARKSVANFKVREGETVGVKVTLRGDRMWEFLDRLLSVALPRVRDFRGINPNAFDGRGNYSFGLKEQLIFPEIEYDKVDKIRGMDICICTTAKTDEEAKELLSLIGAPFYA